MGKISTEMLRKAYILSAKRLFFRDMSVLEQTRIHDVALKLGITDREVGVIWHDPKH